MNGLTAAATITRPQTRDDCAHCGERLAPGAQTFFCCAGCATAYDIVAGLGLERFYERLRLDPKVRRLRPSDDAVVDYAAHCRTAPDGLSRLYLMIDGLHCAACVWLIESILARDPRVVDGRVNMTTRRLSLAWRGPVSDADRLVASVRALGFRLVPYDPAVLARDGDARERELLRALAVSGFAAANVMLLSVSVWAGHVEGMGAATRDLMHWLSALIALPAIAYAGRPFFRSALASLAAGRANMDVPISVGVSLAAAASLFETARSGSHAYFDSAIALVFFLLIGRYLDAKARGKARSAAEQLVGLASRAVTVVRPDGGFEARIPSSVKPGEAVFVAAGERIGVDGRVIDGASDVDQSLVTGESAAVAASAGTPVFAGTINLSGPLRLEARASGDDTLLAEIVRLIEAAERSRGRFTVLADRVARRYAPVVHLAAFSTFLGWWLLAAAPWPTALLNAVAVLIITCPCALALAVPAVQVAATGRLMRRGILVKSGTALERLNDVDTIVFDKTGTLTLGRPMLTNAAEISTEDLAAAACLACASRHPLARALVASAPTGSAAPCVEEVPGQGLRRATEKGEERLGSRRFCGIGDSERPAAGPELWLTRPGRAPVRFAFADRLRPDALETVAVLRAAGYSIEILSGDRKEVVAAIAGDLGVADWSAEHDPAAKTRRLETLAREGRRTLMVGDGMNDAPALAAAYVSMSPSSAVDVSQNSADIVFQGESLTPVSATLHLARRARRLVTQNLAMALTYNLAAVPLAVLGYVTPLIAAASMSSSSLIVIVNALRLQRERRR
ncbi:MAG TPA: heavy metal translocating P-type ATPase [Alphaproteobacteria bacterium]|nr:heavy metal translocating P-type ATPase [Alphaproteobacteria bacterium]